MNKIVVITSIPFPNGFAPSNRIISYCKGFEMNNYLGEIVVIKPNRESVNKGFGSKGSFEGINYIFPGKKVLCSANFVLRQFQYYYSITASIFYIIINYFFKKKSDFIIFYGHNPFFEIIVLFFSKLCNVVLYKEQSENPYLFFHSYKFLPQKIVEFLYMKIIYKSYSGILVMTSPLKKLFIKSGITEKKVLIVNNAVFIDKFISKTDNKNNEEYFAFIGSLNQKKDGILTLLEALAVVKKKYPNIRLKIAGFGFGNDVNIFHDKVSELSLNNNVEYLGCLDSFSAINLIRNATGLLSARPNSLQAEYGFPTKIIEYLATGNPVVTTITGDLKLFLIDNENAFIAPVDSSDGFAISWLKLLDDMENAHQIGRRGQLLVKDIFNPQIQTKRIIDFYNNSKH